ncbi:hypothetical protein AMTR_s00002p00247880 [Amborella trichopoda]|uniref:Uncharacterized protein n=1 Tax=Amborella trichopoda TaxID=13333 RepID=W1P2T7_AMBTC|nr:hypothetical protein AMTR_s00002p00247880 [Amborella trichopoda]
MNLTAEVALGLLMMVATNFLMIIIVISMGVLHLLDLTMLIWFCRMMLAATQEYQEMRVSEVVLPMGVVNMAAEVALGVLMMVVNNFWMIIFVILMRVFLLVDLSMLIWFCHVTFAATPKDQETRVIQVASPVGVVNLVVEVTLDLAMLIWFCRVMFAEALEDQEMRVIRVALPVGVVNLVAIVALGVLMMFCRVMFAATPRSINESDSSGAAGGYRELGCKSGTWCVDDGSQQFLDDYLCHRYKGASPCRFSHVDLVLSRDVCCNTGRSRNKSDPSGVAGGCRELGCISGAWCVDDGSQQFLDDYLAIAIGVLLLVDLTMLIWYCHVKFSATPEYQVTKVI